MEYNITYRQKDKGWQYIISYKDHEGKWRQKSKQGFKSRSLAKKAADERLDEMKKKFKIKLVEDHDKITLKDFKEMFLTDIELHKECNTIKTYDAAFNKFETLNDMKMEDIEYAHIQNCINEMIKEELEPSTIKAYTSKMNTLFKAAAKPYKIILESPITEDIMTPKSKKDKDEKVKALTQSELQTLLNKMYPEKDYIICLLASNCGPRIGEIIGLCESDVDLKKGELNINKQWKLLKDGTYGFGTVKSQNRIVPIPKSVIGPLKKYLSSNVKSIGRRIFPEARTNSTSARLSLKMKQLGFDNSVHDLRHTYATTLISNGVDFKTVAELMGDTVETVIKTYSHFTEDMMSAVAKKVNRIFL